MFDDRTERNIATLIPDAQVKARTFMTKVIAAMSSHGITAKIISGTRTYAEQDALYAQGRTKPGKKVTNARGGFSNHNFGIAWDIGLFKGPTYLEESPYYHECVKIGRSLNLECGADWTTFPDEPHFQCKSVSLAELRQLVASHSKIPVFD